METFNEQSAASVRVSLYDFDGVLAAPLSFSYKIDCLTTGQIVRALTAVTAPTSQIDLGLEPNDTAILGDNAFEERIITVYANYGVGDNLVAEYRYVVKNLSFVPVE